MALINTLLTPKIYDALIALRDIKLSTNGGNLCLRYEGWDKIFATEGVQALVAMSRQAGVVEPAVMPAAALSVISLAEAEVLHVKS